MQTGCDAEGIAAATPTHVFASGYAAFSLLLVTPSLSPRAWVRALENPIMLPQFRIVPLAVACALGLPSLAFAQTEEATELDEIIVTATRTDIALVDSIVPAQVIDREEIERSQARSLPELLRGRAGIDVSNQGGMGKLTSVFMRGAESDHVLVLVDGIRIGSASAGLASFQDLPVDQIERIEIVRGPRSSLYGSEAIGGVIQIFTRQGGEGFQHHLRVGAGSNGLREAGAGFGNRTARGWISAELRLSGNRRHQCLQWFGDAVPGLLRRRARSRRLPQPVAVAARRVCTSPMR